jgi:multiple sugar transport system permease protein
LSNYFNLFLDDGLFLTALKNTFLLSVITGPIGYLLNLMIAWMVNELDNTARAFVTLLFYSPAISGGAYAIWAIIYSGDMYGFLNGVLLKLGFISTPIQWLTDTKYMMGAAIAVILWLSFGTGFLSLIAGFKNVDKSLYEAAAVDGIKNRYQELWYITLPTMKPQLMFSAVMSITGSFGMGGVITAVFGFPSSGYALHTLAHHMEDYGSTRFEMGYASAIAVVLFVIMVSSNGIVQRLLNKLG